MFLEILIVEMNCQKKFYYELQRNVSMCHTEKACLIGKIKLNAKTMHSCNLNMQDILNSLLALYCHS